MSGPASHIWRFSVNKSGEDVAAGDDGAEMLPSGIEGVTGVVDDAGFVDVEFASRYTTVPLG